MSGSCVIYSYMYFLCLIATQPCDLFMLCYAKSLQSCLTLCDPIDGSPPGSAILGILQARTLEWVAISFSSDLFMFIFNDLVGLPR